LESLRADLRPWLAELPRLVSDLQAIKAAVAGGQGSAEQAQQAAERNEKALKSLLLQLDSVQRLMSHKEEAGDRVEDWLMGELQSVRQDTLSGLARLQSEAQRLLRGQRRIEETVKGEAENVTQVVRGEAEKVKEAVLLGLSELRRAQAGAEGAEASVISNESNWCAAVVAAAFSYFFCVFSLWFAAALPFLFVSLCFSPRARRLHAVMQGADRAADGNRVAARAVRAAGGQEAATFGHG
jgi:hypothetical protein